MVAYGKCKCGLTPGIDFFMCATLHMCRKLGCLEFDNKYFNDFFNNTRVTTIRLDTAAGLLATMRICTLNTLFYFIRIDEVMNKVPIFIKVPRNL